MLACDFLTVETIFLRRIDVVFFISLATRRIEYVACSSNPAGRWATQQARNLAMQFAHEQPFRFLIHDRDTKFGRAFDEVFRAEGIKVIPVAALRVSASAGADGPVVVLSGEADPTTATVLREMLAAQLDTGARLVTVDASGLSFLDSASVRVLVLAARALQGKHGRLVLARP